MKLRSVSMQRWMLWSALPCGMLNAIHFGLACAFCALWMFTGLLFETKPYAYTRKTGPLRESARAFLLLSSEYLLLFCFRKLGMLLFSDRTLPFLIYMFAVPLFVLPCLNRFHVSRFSPSSALVTSSAFVVLILLLFL